MSIREHARNLRESWNHGGRWKIIWRTLLVVVLVVYGVFGIWAIRYRSTEFNPLNDIQVQTVGSFSNPSSSRQSVTIDNQAYLVYVVRFTQANPSATLPVTFVKCNSTKDTVDVEVASQWSEVSPPGVDIPAGVRIEHRLPGCQPNPLNLNVPVDVILRAAQIKVSTGQTISLWQVVGRDTPRNPNGSTGTPKTWQTQNFAIEYDG